MNGNTLKRTLDHDHLGAASRADPLLESQRLAPAELGDDGPGGAADDRAEKGGRERAKEVLEEFCSEMREWWSTARMISPWGWAWIVVSTIFAISMKVVMTFTATVGAFALMILIGFYLDPTAVVPSFTGEELIREIGPSIQTLLLFSVAIAAALAAHNMQMRRPPKRLPTCTVVFEHKYPKEKLGA